MATLTAPQAPGALGLPVEPGVFLTYLQQLDGWIQARRSELDALDQSAQQQGNQAVTSDLMLSMALWKSCQERYELLVATWDSGRVGPAERDKLSTLVWGRMDTGATAPGSTGLSLPEACRLSDALVKQLRTRLQLDPDADAATARLSAVRATIERLRDQVGLEPAASRADVAARVEQFAARADDVAAKAARGGDVGGLLGPLELESAEYERDLIVGGARRRQQEAAATQIEARRADLTARAQAVTKLVAQTSSAVVEAPNYAVPDVSALGPVPTDAGELDAYAARLDQVSRALQVVQQTYSEALARRTRIADSAAEQFRTIDAARHADPDLLELRAITQRMLDRTPTPLSIVEPLVAALRAATGTTEHR